MDRGDGRRDIAASLVGPAVFPDQWALVLVTAVVLVGSIALVLWAVFG